MATRAQAEAAEGSLRAYLAAAPWFAGTDIVTLKCGGDSARLMVLVRGSAEQVKALADCPMTPRSWHGVPIDFVRKFDAAEGLGATPLAYQDYVNIGVGFAVLLSTFIVGKIAVQSIIAARQEHFDRKGQSPAAIESKETTMDGVVKFLGTGYGLYMMSKQLPEIWKEAQKYVR